MSTGDKRCPAKGGNCERRIYPEAFRCTETQARLNRTVLSQITTFKCELNVVIGLEPQIIQRYAATERMFKKLITSKLDKMRQAQCSEKKQ